ncbi:MAG: hypothetical protein JW946_02420 [Candidatus Omnitrophica bacterium]|nr:hypothetical protein [Candidatus Omnitrophota bacterium]
MTIVVICCFVYANLCIATYNIAFADDQPQWQEIKGEHFLIYFTGDEKFAKESEQKAEYYYRNIALDLGYQRYSEFWLWDNRVKIYIYPDHASYIKATGQPEWSHGMANYKTKQIASYTWSEGFLESLLPHEIAHLIFRDFIGFKGEAPLWLDEGVAQWAEYSKRNFMKSQVKNIFDANSIMLVNDMMKVDFKYIQLKDVLYIRATLTKEGEPGVVFLTGDELIKNYYIQAFSMVSFLVEKYGAERFSHFCRELRDGKSFEAGLNAAYRERISGINEFQNKWREYLLNGQK